MPEDYYTEERGQVVLGKAGRVKTCRLGLRPGVGGGDGEGSLGKSGAVEV